MKRALITSLISLILLTVLGQLSAPARADPMRPLVSAAAAASANTNVAAPAALATAGPRAAQAPAEIRTERLVAIRRNADGRAEALIGEHWVGVGGKAGNATVSRVDASSVTLKLGRQQQVLHVLPQLVATVEPAAPATATATAATATTPRRTAATRTAALMPPTLARATP